MKKKQRKNTHISYPLGIALILSVVITSGYADLRYSNGYFYHDDGIPVYLHGAGTSFILLDPNISIEKHNAWYDSLGANANRVKGFHRKDKYGLAPWVTVKPWKAPHEMYDLLRFNPSYLARLNEYAIDMHSRNNYFIFQFFDGELLSKDNLSQHPFNKSNNINEISIQGDPNKGFYDIANQSLLRYQKHYLQEIVKTLAPYGNVIFELSTNYSGDIEWQRFMCQFLHDLGEKYNTKVLIINDIPLEMIESSCEDLDGFDIHRMANGLTPEEFSELAVKMWEYQKPIFNSYALLGSGGKFANKNENERLILTNWLHQVHGVQFGGAGPAMPDWRKPVYNYKPFRFFHLCVDRHPFWTFEPHHELASDGWCIAHPGYEYITLSINAPEVTLDFYHASEHLGYKMYNPITLESDGLSIRESTPVPDRKTFPNKVGGGPMVIINVDGIAKKIIGHQNNDIHIAWQANRTIYHKMKRREKWHATEIVSNPSALFTKHVEIDIDDDRNVYVAFGGPPPWKKGSELLDYRSQWRKFNGQSWGPVELLNDGPWPAGCFADLVVDHTGRIHYIYSERDKLEERFKAEAKAVIVEPDGTRNGPTALFREGSKDLHFQVEVDSKNRVYAMNGWRFKCRIKVWFQDQWGPEIDFPGLYDRQNFWGWHARVGKDDLIYVVGSSGGRKPPEGPDFDSHEVWGNINFTRPLLMWILKPTDNPYQPELGEPVYFGYGSFAKMCINPATGYPVVVYSRKGDLFYREWSGEFFEPEYEIPTPGIHVIGFDDVLFPRAGNAIAIDYNGNWHVAFAGVETLYYLMRKCGENNWSDTQIIHAEHGLCRIEIRAIPPKEFAKRRW